MTSISLRQSELGNRLQSPAEARVAAGRLANGSVTYLLSRHARPIIWRSVGPLPLVSGSGDYSVKLWPIQKD